MLTLDAGRSSHLSHKVPQSPDVQSNNSFIIVPDLQMNVPWGRIIQNRLVGCRWKVQSSTFPLLEYNPRDCHPGQTMTPL